MECKQCGGAMMAETVIKLRRGFFGFRESRSRGAYCFTCKIAVPGSNYLGAPYQPTKQLAEAYRAARGLLPKQPPTGMFRSGGSHKDSIRLGNSLPLPR